MVDDGDKPQSKRTTQIYRTHKFKETFGRNWLAGSGSANKMATLRTLEQVTDAIEFVYFQMGDNNYYVMHSYSFTIGIA